MDGRKALEAEVDFRAAPEVPLRAGLGATAGLPVWLAVVAGLLGPVLAEVRTLLEPASADPDTGLPLIAVVVGVVELAAWVGAGWLALQRRPGALGFAAVAAAAAAGGVGVPHDRPPQRGGHLVVRRAGRLRRRPGRHDRRAALVGRPLDPHRRGLSPVTGRPRRPAAGRFSPVEREERPEPAQPGPPGTVNVWTGCPYGAASS
jgi:hypothetical protein